MTTINFFVFCVKKKNKNTAAISRNDCVRERAIERKRHKHRKSDEFRGSVLSSFNLKR